MRFTIRGAPRTKKNSPRVVQVKRQAGGVYHKPIPSKAYANYERLAVPQVRQAIGWFRTRGMTLPLREDQGVNVRALFYCDRAFVDQYGRPGDTNGYYQGLADVLQVAGLLTNDSQILSWNGTEVMVDDLDPRVIIEITARDPGPGAALHQLGPTEDAHVSITVIPAPRPRRGATRRVQPLRLAFDGPR